MKIMGCVLAGALGVGVFAACTPEEGGDGGDGVFLGENFNAVDTENEEKVITEPTFSVSSDIQENAELFTPNSLFSDNMILQRNAVTHIWGTTSAQAVAARVDGNVYYGTVENGNFSIWLAPHKEGSGYSLELLSPQGKLTIENVCFGEVFLLSGQSNMAWRMSDNLEGDCGNHAGTYVPSVSEPTYEQWAGDSMERNNSIRKQVIDKLDACEYENIRIYNVPIRSAGDAVYEDNIKKTDAGGSWQNSSAQTMTNFSAVGCHFLTKLHELTGIPVGAVSASLGATFVPTWMSEETYNANRGVCMYGGDRTADAYNKAARCYNQYIYPILSFKFKSAVWYQGEGQPQYYADSMKALISGWRSEFGYELPFIIIGLPRSGAYDVVPSGYASAGNDVGTVSSTMFESREQQKLICSLEKVYLTVNVDVGDYDEEHPADKQPVGERVAFKVMEAFYGTEGDWSAPELVSAERGEEGVTLTFSNAGGGITVINESRNLEAAGTDGVYYPAQAVAAGEDGLIVTCDSVSEIVSIRYGYYNYPKLDRNNVKLYMSLFNASGFPVDQFSVSLEEV